MKKLIVVFLLTVLSNLAFGQTDYARAHAYANKWNFAAGLKLGELSGLQIQIFKGAVCGGHQDVLNKSFSLSVTAGYSRWISKTRVLEHNDSIYTMGQPDFRIQLDAGKTFLHTFDTDISFLFGISGGQRTYELNSHTAQMFTTGIMPGLGIEHAVWHSSSRNAPIYLTAFGEVSLYKELGEVSFWDVYLSAGCRFNFWH